MLDLGFSGFGFGLVFLGFLVATFRSLCDTNVGCTCILYNGSYTLFERYGIYSMTGILYNYSSATLPAIHTEVYEKLG